MSEVGHHVPKGPSRWCTQIEKRAVLGWAQVKLFNGTGLKKQVFGQLVS